MLQVDEWKWTPTDVVALYGALVATLALLISALVDETSLKFEKIADFAAWDSFDRTFRAPYASVWRRAFWAVARRFMSKN